MLLQLAKRNVSRNWTKSILGILGVAVAAAVMTASFSLQTGYPEAARVAYRAFMGADVVIYPGTLGMEYQGAEEPEDAWQWSLRGDEGLSDLVVFHPGVYEAGYIHPPDDQAYFATDELPGVLCQAGRPQEVISVQPLLKLPARLVVEGEGGQRQLHSAGLRARDVELDHQQWDRWNMSEYLERGRWLQPEDDGSLTALAFGRRPDYPDHEGVRPTYDIPPVSQEVTVQVPTLLGYRDGLPVWDWDRTKTLQIYIAGHFVFPTEERAVRELGGQVLDEPIRVQYYLETKDLFIPQGTWASIFDEISPRDTVPRAYQMNVILQDMYQAKTVTEQLSDGLPGATVRSVPQQVMLSRRDQGQAAIPADVSAFLIVGSLLIAGLLLVANMYILVMQRRKDMAILKAVGMSPGQVMGLIILETVIIALIGAVVGFGAVRLCVTGVLLISDVGVGEIGMLTVRMGAQVFGASLLLAVVFGSLPAYQAVRQTTMEVLRDVGG